jgi:hypothetical protein
MLNYHQIGTAYTEQLANSPVSRFTDWAVDSIFGSILFLHYLPSNILTGTQPQWNLLIEPTRASMGPWLGSNICRPN